MTQCMVCKAGIMQILDCGMQPVSNRFVHTAENAEALFPLVLGVCEECGLVQLSKRIPEQELIPKYDWIKYTEPEEHVNLLAHMIAGLNKGHRVLGISPKDDSVLEKLQGRGFTTYRLTEDDLSCSLGSESVQKAISEKADSMVQKYGTFSIVIARQIFEHAYNPGAFISALKKFTAPGGLIVIETPDSTKQLDMLDYGMMWEEHVMYFTSATLKNTLARQGLKIEQFFVYPYKSEPSAIACVRKGQEQLLPVKDEINRARRYGELFNQQRQRVRDYFDMRKKEGSIALFGAGHMACMLINLFGLQDFVDSIIDDSSNKKKMLMPLSHIPINDSAILSGKKTLVFTVNPNAEDNIIAKYSSFQGEIVSLCPSSSRSFTLWKEKSPEVFYSLETMPLISARDIDSLKEKSLKTQRQRSRLCTHMGEQDKLHEMIIVHHRQTYVRPHKHLNKVESVHVIEGTALLITFDDEGKIEKRVMLGDYRSGHPFYYRMNTAKFHMLLIISDTFIFAEAATGPFERNDTIFPAWAPEEKEMEKVQQFIDKVRGSI